MLVGVNAQGLNPQTSGTARCLRTLLRTMQTLQPDLSLLLFTDAESHAAFDGFERVAVESGGIRSLFGGSTPGADVARAAKTHKVEALWSLPENAPERATMPVILFATDLLACEPDVITQERPAGAVLRHYKKVCANAAAIVSPSEYLRQSYLKLLEIPLNKIVVAPLGVDEGFGQPQRTIAEPPYLLLVGSTRPERNIPRLREAISRLEPEQRHTLVVVGPPGPAEPPVWEGDVVRVEYCPVPQLAGLYQHCQVCIIPSLYDGTGLTALEALRSGAIIAAARVGAIPEFAGDAPFYFMPNNVTSVANALRRALDEGPQERANRGRAARQMVVGYTWENCAWKALSAFHRI